MPKFGPRSLNCLQTTHPKLVKIANEVIKTLDHSVICGHRNKADQEAAFAQGNTKVHYPNSPHNQLPSCAIDVLPYPFKGWNDKNIHKELRAIALAYIAEGKKQGVELRHGADWDRDGKTTDERFVDSPHIELHPWRNFT